VDVRLCEYFVAVVDHGGITKAANALYIAQPSLSQAIRGLEREVGAELFDRSGRQFVLTEAGRTFEVSARRVLRDVELARQHVEAVRELRAGRLQIAAVADLTLHPLPGLVRDLREAHPSVAVRIRDSGSPAGVVAAVRQGEAELGLTTLPVKAEALTVHRLRSQRMVLAMTPDLADGLPHQVPQAMLPRLPLLRETDDPLAALLLDPAYAEPAGPGGLRIGLRQVLWELTMTGTGIAVLPEGFVRTQMAGRVVALELDPPLHRDVGLVYRADQLSPAAEAFVQVAASSSWAASA